MAKMKLIHKRHWFGFWWASICSKHAIYNGDCDLCKVGYWTKINSNQLFGTRKYIKGRLQKPWYNKMKICSISTDGGNKSNVTGYWLIEAKSLFSIVLLRFGKGSRENYHNHAFNAWTWFIKGEVDEQHKDGHILRWKPSIKPKYTPKDCFHKVFAKETTWALSFRGPWDNKWKEYNPNTNKEITLTHGRRVLDE